jgi:hypothetical protein
MYADIVPQDLLITNPNGTKSAIKQEEVTASKKTLGIYDTPAGGNQGHLDYIRSKATTWINRMANGHPPQPHCVGSIQTPTMARAEIQT